MVYTSLSQTLPLASYHEQMLYVKWEGGVGTETHSETCEEHAAVLEAVRSALIVLGKGVPGKHAKAAIYSTNHLHSICGAYFKCYTS